MTAPAASAAQERVHVLGAVELIPEGEGKTFLVGETPVAVFRTRDGGVYATQAECPHRAGLLADGLTDATHVVCPLHAYRFRLADGAPAGNECEALKTYPVAIVDGTIVIRGV